MSTGRGLSSIFLPSMVVIRVPGMRMVEPSMSVWLPV